MPQAKVSKAVKQQSKSPVRRPTKPSTRTVTSTMKNRIKEILDGTVAVQQTLTRLDNERQTLPFIEKYRPTQVTDIFQNNNILTYVSSVVASKNFDHSIFYGQQGVGKTSTIEVIARELFYFKSRTDIYEKRFQQFNASDDRSIEFIRTTIMKAVSYLTPEAVIPRNLSTGELGGICPSFKIILLDEADLLTKDAQEALLEIIQRYSGIARFCFICNYPNNIISTIKSRCNCLPFGALTGDQICERLQYICKNEKYDRVIDSTIVERIALLSDGDMRRAISLLQSICDDLQLQKIIMTRVCDLEFQYIPIYPMLTVYAYKNPELLAMTPKRQKVRMNRILDQLSGTIKIDKIVTEMKAVCENRVGQIMRVVSMFQAAEQPITEVLTCFEEGIAGCLDGSKKNKKGKKDVLVSKLSNRIIKSMYRIKSGGSEYLNLVNLVNELIVLLH